jgi:diguanylate cyclase (GGDEF)-like protein/PAS domain S-box-containing protein
MTDPSPPDAPPGWRLLRAGGALPPAAAAAAFLAGRGGWPEPLAASLALLIAATAGAAAAALFAHSRRLTAGWLAAQLAGLRDSEARLRLLADSAVDMVLRIEEDETITYASPSTLDILGWAPADLVGKTPAAYTHPEDARLRDALKAQAVREGRPILGRFRAIHRDGTIVWLERRTRVVHTGGRLVYIAALRDVTMTKQAEDVLAQANQQLARLALVDALTGIANRRGFDEALAKEWRRSLRLGKPLSLLMLDVDHFKDFNDLNGHQAGDHCLAALAQRLEGFAQRPGDLAARYGGEEFALILPACDEPDARQIAERIRKAVVDLQIPHQANRRFGSVTISIGVATAEPAGANAQDGPDWLLKMADKVLYEAKRTGRNKVVALSRLACDAAAALADDEARLVSVSRCIAACAGHREELDRICYFVASVMKTPMCVISIITRDEQLFIGRFGVDVACTPREFAMCGQTMTSDMPMLVEDMRQDPRFRDNPLVIGAPGLRCYFGAPLITAGDGTHLGALCVTDLRPRDDFGHEQMKLLSGLAGFVTGRLEALMAELEAKTGEVPVS